MTTQASEPKIENPPELKPLRAYIVYGGSRDMLHAMLIFENGWAAFGHMCSHPGYMPGDLIVNRSERQAILAEMGYRVELAGEPIAGSDNAPDWLLAAHKNKAGWEPMADEYAKISARQKGPQ